MKQALIILLFCSSVAKAQVPVDSLKAICKNLYEIQLSNQGYDIYKIGPVEEIFQGYFNNAKIFIASCTHGSFIGDDIPRSNQLYALNPSTGEKIELNGVAPFNNIFEERKPLCNLDKCYLYMLLSQPANDAAVITNPSAYRKPVKENSIFLKDHLPLIRVAYTPISNNNQPKPDDSLLTRIEEVTGASTINKITVFKTTHTAVYQYRFILKHGKIKSITESVLN